MVIVFVTHHQYQQLVNNPNLEEEDGDIDESDEKITNFLQLFTDKARELGLISDQELLDELRTEKYEYNPHQENNDLNLDDFSEDEIKLALDELISQRSEILAHNNLRWEIIGEIREEYQNKFDDQLRDAFDEAYPQIVELFNEVEENILNHE